ncbi:TD and POZ domain-containing protein 2 [Halotydeus destructor]|nr:TD and POZ domain-containing protein 2 [Halotydeus destructor]
MTTTISFTHEHLIGPDWFNLSRLSEEISFPSPLNVCEWRLSEPVSGHLKLQLTKPNQVPCDTQIELFVRYARDKSEPLSVKEVVKKGVDRFIFVNMPELAAQHKVNATDGLTSFLGLRTNYPLHYFKDLLIRINKMDKVLQAFGKEAKSSPASSLFNCDDGEDAAVRNVPTIRSRRRSSSEQFEEISDMDTYSMSLNYSFDIEYSSTFEKRDSDPFSPSPFSVTQFQLRIFKETPTKCGLILRASQSFPFPLRVSFSIAHGKVFCEEHVYLRAGEVETRTIRLQFQSYSVLGKLRPKEMTEHKGRKSRTDDRDIQALYVVTAAVNISFPKDFVDKFCEEFDERVLLSQRLYEENPEVVTIRVGGKEIKCNRGIMTSASPYFEAMLSGNFAESDSSVITFTEENFRFEVMQEIIEFIHSETWSSSLSRIDLELYEAGEYFGLEGLKQMAAKNVVEKLSPSKALRALIAAHKYNDAQFKKPLVQFVIRHFSNVQKLADWPTMFTAHPELVNDLLTEMRKLIKYPREKEIKETKLEVPKKQKLHHQILCLTSDSD